MDVCKFVVFLICSIDPSNDLDGKRIIVDPKAVMFINKPKNTPEGCVKITFTVGRGVYVEGTEESVAKKLSEAKTCSG